MSAQARNVRQGYMTLFSGIKKLGAGLYILLRESYILESPLTRPYPMQTPLKVNCYVFLIEQILG